MVDMKLAILFVLGMFMAFLWYLEELITQKEIIEQYGILGVAGLSFINSVLGGVVAVVAYYGLTQYIPELHEYLKVGIASATAFFGKQMMHLYRGLLGKLVEKVGGDK